MKKLLLLIFFLPALAQAKKIYLKQGYQNGVSITRSQAAAYSVYDTLVLKGNYGDVDFQGLYAKSDKDTLVITIEGNVIVTRINIDGCSNIKIDGQFGLLIQRDAKLIVGGFGIDIFNNCKNIFITRLAINNLAMGVHISSPVYCQNQDSLNRKGGGGQENIWITYCTITNIWYEGIYASTTSPNNHNNDPRTNEDCPNYRPEPARAKDVHVLHNTVLNTGRGNIQLGAVDGIADIGWNVARYSGMNGNDAQGTNISVGMFTHAYIHDNVIGPAFTNNIGLLGGSAKVENNVMDSNFKVRGYDYKTIEENDSRKYIDPLTEPRYDNTAAALYGNQTSAIYVKTGQTVYKDPIRNETRGYVDSSSFQLINNKFGNSIVGWGAWIEDGYKMMKQIGNCVFNTPNVGTESQIKYSKTACSSQPVPPAPNKIPIAFAGRDTTMYEGTFTRTGQGIDSDGTIKSYYWEYASGTDLGHSSLQTLSAALTSGTYQMTLYVTDDKGAVGQDVLLVTALPPKPVEKTVFHAGYFNLNGKRFYYIMYNDGTWVGGKK